MHLTAGKKIEFLIRSAEFHVGFQSDGVIAHREWIQELVHGDWLLFLKAIMKVVAFQQLRHCVFFSEADEIDGAEFREPSAVEVDHRFLMIENFEDLLFIGLRIAVDLFAR